MKKSLQRRLTLMITLFVALSLLFFTGVTLFNNHLQLDMLSEDPPSFEVNLDQSIVPVGPELDSVQMTPSLVVVQSQRWFSKITIWAMLVFILIAAVIAFLLSKKALQPIEKFRKEVAERTVENLAAPFPIEKNTPAEIVSLQNSFQQMSERVSESYELQRRFANNAAHELRTPIATMKTGLQMLSLTSDELTREELAETLDKIQKQVNRLSDTVTALETLSEKTRLIKDKISLTQLFTQLTSEFQPSLQEKNLTFVTPVKDCQVIGQKNLLYHAFRNLLENAVKYATPHSEIKIYWTETPSFLFTIENQGPAIPEADQPHIFQAFYRGDDSRSRQTGGSGLGLSLVEKIITRHNGTLKLIKSDETGTLFQVSLPN